MTQSQMRTVPVDSVEACPYQPRVNVSVALVARLADSMKAGRHEPLLDVEPVPTSADRFRIVCGERWRAAHEAGISEMLVRVHSRLGYLDRLRTVRGEPPAGAAGRLSRMRTACSLTTL